jgi:hypothetical protein
MVLYDCPRCGYTTSQLSNYKSHLKRKTLCPALKANLSLEDLLSDYLVKTQKDNKEYFHMCTSCSKVCKNPQCKYQHDKHCKGIADTENITILANEVIRMKKQIEDLSKGNSNLTHNTTNNIQNIQNTITITPQVQLRDFGCENMDALPEDFIGTCLMKQEYRDLLEGLHYDPEYPENKNVRIKSVKRNMMEIYRNNKWNVVTLSNGLEELIKQGTRIFQSYARDNEHKILQEDMDENELYAIMDKLKAIEDMNKKYVAPMTKDIQALLESHSKSSAVMALTYNLSC